MVVLVQSLVVLADVEDLAILVRGDTRCGRLRPLRVEDGLLRVCFVSPTPNNLSSSVLAGSDSTSSDLGFNPADRGLLFLFNKFPHISPSLVCRTVVIFFILPGGRSLVLLVLSLGAFCGLAWRRRRCPTFHFMASAPSPVDDFLWSIICVDRRLILAIGLVPLLPFPPSTSIKEARCAVLGSGDVGARSLALQDSLCGDLWPIKRFSLAAGACAKAILYGAGELFFL